ncbi:bifunctional diguanylate cyclase/phosphodiesterase [Pseudorhodoferax sp. Leaf265]|uniref:putative bifunctional diguanylate cyclase/phosphodiesterase n=1 Tax=Pseudorhodoferax sp. Leaf265 TaxID=1736315 RepID=UPI0012E764AA|nr:EAL domain-containing protein [Pseudorhodoferax sp. Leaf265]
MSVSLRGRPLSWRLTAGFIAFAAAILCLGSLVLHQAERWSERAAVDTLRATVQLGARGMNAWLAERFADADVFSSHASMQHVLRHAVERGVGKAEEEDIQNSLDAIRQRYGYPSVSIIDTEQKLAVFSSGVRPRHADIALATAVAGVDGVRWIDLPFPGSANAYRAAVVRRIAAHGPLAHFVFYLEVDPVQLVRALTQSSPKVFDGHGILMRVQDGKPVRFGSIGGPAGESLAVVDDVVAGSIEHRLLTAPQNLVKGVSGSGHEAIAMREALSLPGWYLVGVLDETEIHAGLREPTRVAMVAYGVLLALVAAGLVLWLRAERHHHFQREAEMAGFYDQILRGGDALFVLNDWRGKVVDASESTLKAFRLARDQLIGSDIMALAPDSERDAVLEMVKGMRPGDSRRFTGQRRRSDGSIFFVEGSVGLLEIQGRRYFHSVATDVTQARELQARLQQAASVFELAPAAIVVCNSEREVVSVNPAFTAITGYTPEEVLGVPVEALTTGADPEKNAMMVAAVLENDFWEGELEGRRKNGQTYPRHMLAAAHRDASGEVYQFVGMFTDLTALREAQTRAEFHANHDQLTGLPNRRRLDAVLPTLVRQAAERDRSLTVVVLNLDRFKSINESFGLPEGDRMLVALAQRLQASLPADKLFHFGADEFVGLLEGPPVGHALTINRMLEVACCKYTAGTHAITPSVSVGVASYPELSQDAESLLRNAGAALSTAKCRGGKTWQLYEPAMNASAHDDMLLAVELQSAIEHRQLELHYQPQARLSNWSLTGVEALLRWKHPRRGMVSPARFVPIAEASGLIVELSQWVLEEACRTWAGWCSDGLLPPPIAVNVSALQFSRPGFVEQVQQTMARFGVAPHGLVLELTESLIMESSEAAVATMERLSAMGVRIALDDFGTGYSSLSYLTRFPLDKLKIDRSFVLPIGTAKGQEAEAIVQSVVSMAKALRLRVIAEGVETDEQANFLKDCGCDEMQGYLYSRPIPDEALRSLLETTLPLRSAAAPSGLQPLFGREGR